MESLYRKYRPLTFDSVVGQQHIVSTLEHAVTEGRLSHAYLFCGPRGTGKTTMARILAKALLCKHAHDGAGCMPDGSCEECELIAQGAHPDVYELDAASRTGVDNVREEIINSVNFAPVRGSYKVYIIDEVHMLTTAAFNALLKTLEEPPAHVIFVLCTTDPQKILETILSRCQRFDFHRISNEDIEGRLAYVCEQEGFEYDAEALAMVARHARGGMRDALSTLEQLSVFGGGAVRLGDARSLLGEASNDVLAAFVRGIAERDIVSLFDLVCTQANEGNDIMELTRDLVAHARDVYVVRMAGKKPELFEGREADVESLAREAEAFETPDRIARMLSVLDAAALEMRNASDARLVLELACTKLARPEADLSLEALAERLDRLEARIAEGIPAGPAAAMPVAAPAAAAAPVRPAPASNMLKNEEKDLGSKLAAAPGGSGLPWNKSAAPAAPARPAPAPAAKPQTSEKAAPAPVPSASESVSAPQAEPMAPKPQPSASTQAAPAPATDAVVASAPQVAAPVQSAPAADSASAPTASATSAAGSAPVTEGSELAEKWADVLQKLRQVNPLCASLLQNGRAVSDDGSVITVALPAGSGFAMKMMQRADAQQTANAAASEVFGPRSVVCAMDGSEAAPAPAPAPKVEPAAAPAAVPGPERPAAPVPAAPVAPATPAKPEAPVRADSAPAVPAAASAPDVPAPQPASPAASTWDDDQVPYDDFAAPSYEDDRPPFEPDVTAVASAATPVTGAPAAAKPAPAASHSAPAAKVPWESAPASREGASAAPWNTAPKPAVPWGAAPKPAASAPAQAAPASAPAQASAAKVPAPAGGPFNHAAGAPVVPKTIDEAKDLIRETFGENTVFTSNIDPQ